MTQPPKLRVRPVTLATATAFVHAVHSHLDRPQGGLFAVGVEADGTLVCVAILGRPTARLIGVATPDAYVAEVTRVASDGSTPHAASKALAALTEAGTIYRACGWHPTAISCGGEHDRPSRRRKPAQQSGQKVRWETGPAALPLDPAADRIVREHVGRVQLHQRQLPLLPSSER